MSEFPKTIEISPAYPGDIRDAATGQNFVAFRMFTWSIDPEGDFALEVVRRWNAHEAMAAYIECQDVMDYAVRTRCDKSEYLPTFVRHGFDSSKTDTYTFVWGLRNAAIQAAKGARADA